MNFQSLSKVYSQMQQENIKICFSSSLYQKKLLKNHSLEKVRSVGTVGIREENPLKMGDRKIDGMYDC